MKKSTLIGLLILGLIFQNCKNEKTQQEVSTDTTIETKTVVKQELDTSAVITDELQTESKTTSTIELEEIKDDIEKIEGSKTTTIETPKATEKEIIKVVEETSEKIIKEETAVIEKEIKEEVDKIVETEKEIEKEVEIVKEPETIIKEEIEVKTETEPSKPVTNADNWIIPGKYKTMTNPEDASKENIAIGKSLYSKHCKSCHGKEGYGDGPKAEEVEGDLGDFTSSEFKAQSDGALFYKSYIGRDDMPNYEKKMSVEDVWLVVHYMRTL